MDLARVESDVYVSDSDSLSPGSVETTRMVQRLQFLIDSAERTAEAIHRDAEERARRHLEEAQRNADRLTAERVAVIHELTADLSRHEQVVRDRSEQMADELHNEVTAVTDRLSQLDLGPIQPPEQDHSISEPTDEIQEQVELGAPIPTSAAAPAQGSQRQQEGSASVGPAEEEDVPVSPNGAPQPPISRDEAERPAISRNIPGAFLHATRLVVAGNDRSSIASTLRTAHGIEDPDAILDRLLGDVDPNMPIRRRSWRWRRR